jgi:hypothetical protein
MTTKVSSLWIIIGPLLVSMSGVGLWISLEGCGRKNALSTYAPKDLYEQAQLDMEAGSSDPARYAAAQEKLVQYLAAHPDNTSAMSLLASCYAARAGFTFFGLLSNPSALGALSSGSNSTSLLDSFGTIAPDATELSLAFMKSASDTMVAIGSESVSNGGYKLQSMVFSTVYAVMLMKDMTNKLSAAAASGDVADVGALAGNTLAVLDTAKTMYGADAVDKFLTTQVKIDSGMTEEQKQTALSNYIKCKKSILPADDPVCAALATPTPTPTPTPEPTPDATPEATPTPGP